MSYYETTITEEKNVTTFNCNITAADVGRMNELYDSGICDVTTQNAAVLALKRLIKPHHVIRIFRRGRCSPYVCEIDDTQIPVSNDISEIFEIINHGGSPAGHNFDALVPTGLILQSSQNGQANEQPVHSRIPVKSA